MKMKQPVAIWIMLVTVVVVFAAIVHAEIRTNNVVHTDTQTPWSDGVWQRRMMWKPRWVKTWQEKKVYVGVWKRVWGPVELNEWVPLPKPPPGWIKPGENSVH